MSLHKSVTINILKKFSIVELQSLKRFILFSTEDKNKNLILAFDFLMQNAPDFNDKECTKENFSKNVFKKKLNEKLDKEINRLMSELKDEVEKYMAYEYTIKKDNIYKHTGQFFWYYSNGMLEQMERILTDMENDIIDKKSLNVRELYALYLEHKLVYAHISKDPVSSYFIWKHNAIFLENRNEIELNTALVGMDGIKNILPKLSEKELSKNKTIPFLKLNFKDEALLHRAKLKFIKQPDKETYLYLKQQLQNKELFISDYERINVIVELGNNINVVANHLSVEKESLDLAEIKFEIGKPIRNGKALYTDIYQYVISLIENDIIDKTKKVMEANKTNIVGINDKENFFAIVKAFISEKERKYGEALQIINNCYGELPRQKRDILLFKIILAYELNQRNLFDSYVNNLRKFVSDKNNAKELAAPAIKHMMSFASYISKLIKLQPRDKEKLTALKQKVVNDKDLLKKSYILNKIEEKLQEK